MDYKAICPLECDQTSFDMTRLTLNKDLRPEGLAKYRQQLKGKIPEMSDSVEIVDLIVKLALISCGQKKKASRKTNQK